MNSRIVSTACAHLLRPAALLAALAGAAFGEGPAPAGQGGGAAGAASGRDREAAIAALVADARAGAPAARLAAIERLGLLREDSALPALRDALASPDLDARLEAIRALGRFAREDLLPLLAAQAADPDPRVAADAVRAMEPAGWPALPFLLDAVRHPVAAVSEAALAGARRAGGVRASAEVLAGAANGAKGDRIAFLRGVLARDAGARAAGDVVRALPDEPAAAPLLVQSLESAYEPVRELALRRLEGLACRRLDAAGWRAWLRRAPDGPLVAWRAEALADRANPLRLAAARALAVPDAAAARALLECPAAAGPLAEEIARALPAATGLLPRAAADWAAWWAANRGRSRLDWLLAALVDPAAPRDRAAAARALAAHRERRAVDFLVACALRDPDPVVREAGAATLAALSGRRDLGADPKAWEDWWRTQGPAWK